MAVIVMENDGQAAHALRSALAETGSPVLAIGDASKAFAEIRRLAPCAVVMDADMPSIGGLGFCNSLRSEGIRVPVVMLSSQRAIAQRAAALDAGVDDYLVKPFSPTELVERVMVQLARERSRMAAGTLAAGRLQLDLQTRKASLDSAGVELTERECGLLACLMRLSDRPVARGDIFAQVWQASQSTSLNVVDVYIGYLRNKLTAALAPVSPLLVTVRNKGFMLVSPPEEPLRH